MFAHILAICLIFGSLYLPTQAAEVPAPVPSSASIKKTPSSEAIYLEGRNCLTQNDPACAALALAKISSLSSYAKLLQGALALQDGRIDAALQSLLPLQAEQALSSEAKIHLHQDLAAAFSALEDTMQATEHLIQAQHTAIHTTVPNENVIESIQQKIWALLNKQTSSLLITIRGHTTSDEIQGWIDLCLASKNVDTKTSIRDWATHYPDHSAMRMAAAWPSNNNPTQHQAKLLDDGAIALILPATDEAQVAKAEAFSEGVKAAVHQRSLANSIRTYISNGTAPHFATLYTQAKHEGATHVMSPDLSMFKEDSPSIDSGMEDVLMAGLVIDDEIQHMVDFASSHAIQRVLLIETDHVQSSRISHLFKEAWLRTNHASEANDYLHVVTLPEGLQSGDFKLLDIRDQIVSIPHDMVLLATTAKVARILKPLLNVSTPTVAFSIIHDAFEPTPLLNAIRFTDIPFLLPTTDERLKQYRALDKQASSELSRYFALGVDALDLLIARQAGPQGGTINGLTGTLIVLESGDVLRRPAIARFTSNGIAIEK
ncbi:MAG: hypothetical protein FJY53_01075 [Betaproteobacteria bacterium]|nr:hypothetical protein [Betaproteobacteria bacterium]